MDLNCTSQDEAFRQEVRAFYADRSPTRFVEPIHFDHDHGDHSLARHIALNPAA